GALDRTASDRETRLCRCDRAAALHDGAGVDIEGSRKGFGAREQALLEADEAEAAAALLRGAEGGVAREGLGELERERRRGVEIGMRADFAGAGLGVVAGLVARPRGAVVGERELHEDAAREALDAEL